jgi:hypothetical protein
MWRVSNEGGMIDEGGTSIDMDECGLMNEGAIFDEDNTIDEQNQAAKIEREEDYRPCLRAAVSGSGCWAAWHSRSWPRRHP